MDRNVTGGW